MRFRGPQALKDSLETIRWGPRELTLRRPVGNWRDLAGCALKKSSCISHPLRSGAVLVFYYQKTFLPAINSD
jgi:hypothetical protein